MLKKVKTKLEIMYASGTHLHIKIEAMNIMYYYSHQIFNKFKFIFNHTDNL